MTYSPSKMLQAMSVIKTDRHGINHTIGRYKCPADQSGLGYIPGIVYSADHGWVQMFCRGYFQDGTVEMICVANYHGANGYTVGKISRHRTAYQPKHNEPLREVAGSWDIASLIANAKAHPSTKPNHKDGHWPE